MFLLSAVDFWTFTNSKFSIKGSLCEATDWSCCTERVIQEVTAGQWERQKLNLLTHFQATVNHFYSLELQAKILIALAAVFPFHWQNNTCISHTPSPHSKPYTLGRKSPRETHLLSLQLCKSKVPLVMEQSAFSCSSVSLGTLQWRLLRRGRSPSSQWETSQNYSAPVQAKIE